jgi:hypothetical protein
MIARAASGWQTVLADLSLILFMVTAATADQPGPDAAPALTLVDPALGDPVAVWREGGAPLADWLASQSKDPRQRLTIVVPYADNPAIAAPRAMALALSARRPSRLLFEPGGAGDAYATLTYDVAQPSTKIAKGTSR